MNRLIIFFPSRIILLAGLGILITGMPGCSSEQDLEIRLSNTIDRDRPDARVVILRDSLAGYIPRTAGESFEVVDSQQESVPFQLDDLNGDGEWDELVLTYSLPAGGTAALFVKRRTDTLSTSFEDRTQVWFARRDSTSGDYRELSAEIRPEWYQRVMTPPFHYQFEGPGWENDNIGFRIYFDERNGFDIWGKQTSDLVLRNVGLEGDYHSMADWGMDILHVGNSLGAGSIGAKKGDRLYRLQGTDKEKFEEVTDGPVRAVFDLTYEGWKVGEREFSIRERISIWAGADGYQNEIFLTGSQDSLRVIAGFVTSQLNGEPVFESDAPFPYILSYGAQSENSENLGMAVITGPEHFADYGFVDFSEGPIDSTAFVELELTRNRPVSYRFIAGWETGNKEFADEQGFENAVLEAGRRMTTPVEIEFRKP